MTTTEIDGVLQVVASQLEALQRLEGRMRESDERNARVNERTAKILERVERRMDAWEARNGGTGQ